MYSYKWIQQALAAFHFRETEYRTYGLFVIRCVVMNPLYQLAESVGKNYLLEFLRHIHGVTRSIIPKACWAVGEDALGMPPSQD